MHRCRPSVRIVGTQWLFPPVIGRPFPLLGREFVDAVDRAWLDALVTAGAELREDDDVDAVIEDRAEARWAVSNARVAVDALVHVDVERRVLPLRIPFPIFDSIESGFARTGHVGHRTWQRPPARLRSCPVAARHRHQGRNP
jgi:hypothetical protein